MNRSDQDTPKKPQPKMDPEQIFQFRCGPGVPCYTECCRDVSIVLTPYDVLKMKNALDMTSGDFLDKHTVVVGKENQLIPLVFLKMNEDDKKCPFVGEDGCTIYENRPWPCRMFPLDMDSDGMFHVIADPAKCKGLDEDEKVRISDWLVEQGIVPYDRAMTHFAEITNPLRAVQPEIENPDVSKMIFMAIYNLDRFREFVFESSFLKRLEVDDVTLEKIKRSDEELLKFAYNWIKFGIFGQILFKVKDQPENKDQPQK